MLGARNCTLAVKVTKLRVGDYVACAGAGYAIMQI